jgi:bifunctional UDP-N-acetylglucosamine pyrophosphorylase/glucosamine-1-phosphate N-acetyltransferase
LLNATTAVILAAGEGKRMKSRLPKVLHRVCGYPMLRYVVEAAQGAGIEKIVLVINPEGEAVKEALDPTLAEYVYQRERLGTGHALVQSRTAISPEVDTVLVLSGDTPLLTSHLLRAVLAERRRAGAAAAVVTTTIAEPGGYGRILRDTQGDILRIVEELDATEEEREICEVNAGVYAFDRKYLFAALERITPSNQQGEYYLTDVLALFWEWGLKIVDVNTNPENVLGVNNRLQLAQAEQIMRQRIREKVMLEGVTLVDPSSTYIEAGVKIGQDTIIHPHSMLTGDTEIGINCILGPFAQVRSSKIGNGATIENAVLVDCRVGDRAKIGPYAYLRPGTELHADTKVGTFVEVKKSVIGVGSKVPHLSYVGDAIISTDVNIGAGTIVCNYDGFHKHETQIAQGAFIGSNTNLVAPVRIGKRAVTGAGSTISKDVPDYALGLERAEQKNISGWMKKKLAKEGCLPEDEDDTGVG